MYLALSICVLFILLMKIVNGAQFLNSSCITLFPPAAVSSATVIVPLTSIYALFSDIPLLYYFFNHSSSIISCLSFADIYIFF